MTSHVLDLGHVREAAALAGQGRRREQLEGRVLAAADAAPSPRSGRPPSTRNTSRWTGRFLVLPVERTGVGHGGPTSRCRGPSRWRRSATRIRRSAVCMAARARGQVGGLGEALRERPLGLRGAPGGPPRGRSRRPCRRSRPSRRPCPAAPAGSRRRSRTYSSCAALADAQLAEARASRPAARGGAGCPARPRCRGRSTIVHVVLVGEPLGRDDLQVERHRQAASLLGALAHVVERAGQEEGLLRQVVGLALEDLLEGG